ncbi:hypothetical protein [Chryseobacterium proteolyticum]|uniref:hypothetical protein n=1 Tax=Chryseobacterium proteolyticum TaxID=118127 RepID=UPI0039839946
MLDNTGSWRSEVKPETIGQFYMKLQTFKEFNTHIYAYEGDVIKVERYVPGEFYIVIIEDISKTPKNLFGSSVITRELIGNIHSNPELLNNNQNN